MVLRFKGFDLIGCCEKVSGRETVGCSEVVTNDGRDPRPISSFFCIFQCSLARTTKSNGSNSSFEFFHHHFVIQVINLFPTIVPWWFYALQVVWRRLIPQSFRFSIIQRFQPQRLVGLRCPLLLHHTAAAVSGAQHRVNNPEC
jgi:hypothetical protein